MFRRALACIALAAWAAPVAALDHFTCYQTVRNSRTQVLQLPASLSLADAFETVIASPTGRAANFLCAPTDKNGEGIQDPGAHLACYKMRYVRQPRFQARSVTVANQFEQGTLEVVRRGRLCVPTIKNDEPSALAIDHFKCYAVRAAALAPPVPVTLADQFGARTGLATRAIEWCQAVSKNGEPILAPDARLTCYKLADLTPAFAPIPASIDNQFGPDQAVRVRKLAELCVPDTTTTTTTSTSSTTTTSASSTTTTSTSSTTTTTSACPESAALPQCACNDGSSVSVGGDCDPPRAGICSDILGGGFMTFCLQFPQTCIDACVTACGANGGWSASINCDVETVTCPCN
jgi:hypothetical protein